MIKFLVSSSLGTDLDVTVSGARSAIRMHFVNADFVACLLEPCCGRSWYVTVGMEEPICGSCKKTLPTLAYWPHHERPIRETTLLLSHFVLSQVVDPLLVEIYTPIMANEMDELQGLYSLLVYRESNMRDFNKRVREWHEREIFPQNVRGELL